ncbi:MAG: outer membrane lipoprotein-sorting protein [Candidatus Kapaibacterium sp.]
MKKLLLLAALILPLLYAPATSQQPTAEEIIESSENSIKGETSRGIFRINIIRTDYTRSMKMEAWWKGNEKALIIVNEPARDKGNKTLKIGGEMWNYLANTETTIIIPTSMMLQSWMGSDLTNDDIVRESKLTRDYHISMAGSETIGGAECWKIKLTPKEDAPVVWGKLHYWVRKQDKLPAKVNYYNEDGDLVRTFQFSDYKVMDKRKIPAKWTIMDKKNPGEKTEFIYENVQFNINIPAQKFSFRELEK